MSILTKEEITEGLVKLEGWEFQVWTEDTLKDLGIKLIK